MESTIRHAKLADLARINEIYNEYIIDRHTSFDTEPWTLEKRQNWFERYNDAQGRYGVMVLGLSGRVVGFAVSSPFHEKAGYARSVETTVVLGGEAVGRGFGGPLLEALLDQVAASGAHRAYASIALPNQPSVTLHRRLGYQEVGVLDEVGYKLDSFHSVLIMERRF